MQPGYPFVCPFGISCQWLKTETIADMNSWEFNKIAGALLGTLLFVMGVHELASILFSPAKPEKPGFEIVVADTGAAEPVEEPEEETVPLAMLLAEAVVADGERSARKCR